MKWVLFGTAIALFLVGVSFGSNDTVGYDQHPNITAGLCSLGAFLAGATCIVMFYLLSRRTQ